MIDPKRFAPADDPIQQGYVYGPELRRAIRVALATERPLLLRGAPGTGKTTMARDFATNLLGAPGQSPGADYYQEVVTSRTEARDLEWRFDTILRLAETQLAGRRRRVELAENYVEPRALWWAFNPDTAKARGARLDMPADRPADDPIASGSSKDRPAVVLIDEIDKAEPEVANDLLEPFDVKTFRVAETGTLVTRQRDVVLVVTTNDERDLPAAFLRRCVVHELTRPDPTALKKIAHSHFGTELEDPGVAAMIKRVESIAQEAELANLRQPGIAEFLDALRAIRVLAPEQTADWDAERKKTEWDAITRLAMWKHPAAKDRTKGKGKKEAEVADASQVRPAGASLGDVSLGDVIRAWRLLGASTEDERRAIARTLGFELREATPTSEPRRTPPAPAPAPEPGPSGAATAPAPPPSTEAPQAIDLVPFTDVQVNPVALPVEGLPRPVAVQPAVLEPLFAPGWSRAIASTLTEHSAPVGPLDLDRTIDLLARRVPIRKLPRRNRLVSATEVVVVVDTRGTLAWFRDDAALLIDRLDAVTRAPVALVESDGAPVLASAMGARDTVRLAASDLDDDEPAPDRVRIGAHGRIIGITDLGLGSPWMRGDPARAEAWAGLAIALRARDASLAIVTPVPIERIPRRLVRLAPCIYWDRSMRPGQVHRLIKGLT